MSADSISGGPASGAFTIAQFSVVEVWAEVARECAGRIGPAMGLGDCKVLTTMKSLPGALTGMAIAIEGKKPYALVGVLSSSAGRADIARIIFQMEPGTVPTERDEADAVGELANVLAGHVKAVANRIDPTMRLALPSVCNTETFATFPTQNTLRVSFGTVPAAIVITLL